MRRLVLVAIAIGIPVLWAFAPYGEDVGGFTFKSYGSVTNKSLRNLAEWSWWPVYPEDAVAAPSVVLGMLGPLYPAMQAALLLFAPAWFGGRRRYAWFLEASCCCWSPRPPCSGPIFL